MQAGLTEINRKGQWTIMKFLSRALFLLSILAVPAAALAVGPGGCVDSPECPTALLGLIGAAGAAVYVRLRSR
jgi:hypothetical protein